MFLGLDTSFYTTSAAVVDREGQLVLDLRNPLAVPAGKRGLAPSEALFMHLRGLPPLLEEALGPHRQAIRGVAGSTVPRPAPGSYLPVFKASEGFGRAVAASLGVPFFGTSHQEGHVMAGLWSARGPENEEFLALHISGGTTELLRVRRNPGGFSEKILGSTADLHAGQFIDRVGVALGLPFPAGPALEAVAATGRAGRVTLPASVKDYSLSFSGPESQAQRLIGHVEVADLALAVLACVSKSLEGILRRAVEETGLKHVLVVGGVAANRYVRERLSRRLEHRAVGARLYFADPRYSTDSAVGVALLARERYSIQ